MSKSSKSKSKRRRKTKDANLVTIVVVLKPFLIREGNEFDTTYKTGNSKTDKLIESRLKKDYTNIKRILDDHNIYDDDHSIFDDDADAIKLRVKGYKFVKGEVYITLTKKSGDKFTVRDAIYIRDEIVDPHDVGPDTWMEGDIVIIDEKENPKGKPLELGVEVINFQTTDGDEIKWGMIKLTKEEKEEFEEHVEATKVIEEMSKKLGAKRYDNLMDALAVSRRLDKPKKYFFDEYAYQEGISF